MTTSSRRAIARPSRRRSPCSGSRALRCSGTGSRGPSPRAYGLDQWEKARLLRAAQHEPDDGYIGTFETKYHYKFWRPVTAIRLADADGNPTNRGRSDLDAAAWRRPRSRTTTPAHAVEGGPGEAVLRRFFRTDHARFATCSTTLPARNCGEERRVAATTAASRRRRRRTGVAHPRRLPLPQGRGRGHRARPPDRRPRGRPLHAARPLTHPGPRRATLRGVGCPVHQDFDPLSPEFLADPYAVLAELPDDEPVFYAPSLDYYVVTRYADVEAGLPRPEDLLGGDRAAATDQARAGSAQDPRRGRAPAAAVDGLARPARAHAAAPPRLEGVHAAAGRGDGAPHPRHRRRAARRGRRHAAVRPGRAP